jgi:hypothetical protein
VTPFYLDLLGFRLSDYMQKPFRAYFFYVTTRHPSLALIETGRNGMHLLMVELFSLDDVGQSYDVALSQPDCVSVTLSRHINDLMTSFTQKRHRPSWSSAAGAAAKSIRRFGNRSN